MTREHLLSPMSNLRLSIARLSRKQKNFAMAQELLIQVSGRDWSGGGGSALWCGSESVIQSRFRVRLKMILYV